MRKYKTTGVALDHKLKRIAKRHAKAHNVSLSSFIRGVLLDYVTDHGGEVPMPRQEKEEARA